MDNSDKLPCSHEQPEDNLEKAAGNRIIPQEEVEALFNVFDQMGIAIYLVNPANYRIVTANRTAERFLGSEPIGKKCYELLLKKRTSPCDECINPMIVKGMTEINSIPWEFKSENRWYKSVSKALNCGDAGILKMEIITDITEMKQLEKETNDLRVFKEKVEDLPHVPVFTFGRRGKINMMNHAARARLEYDKDDLDFLHIWHLIDERTRERIYELTEHLSNSDRQSIDCTVKGKRESFDAHLDILLHRDIKGIFIEGTVFMIEKTKKSNDQGDSAKEEKWQPLYSNRSFTPDTPF